MQPAATSLQKRDYWVGLGLFAVALALRIPCRVQYGYFWDGLQFALAIEQYDLRLGLPHPPGFYLYVMLGRLVNLLVAEPHTALLWINLVTGSALVSATYLLGCRLFGWRSGLMAGLVMLSSPLSWYNSSFVITLVPDSLLVVLLAGLCWQTRQQGGRWPQVLLLGALLAMIGGIRGQTVPALVPLWLYAFGPIRSRRWLKLAAAVATVVVVGLLWFVPMLQSSGGWAVYWDLLLAKSRFDAHYRIDGGGRTALLANLVTVGGGLALGLLLGGALAAAEAYYLIVRAAAAERAALWQRHGPAVRFLAVWIVPQLLFGTLLMYTFAPGYTLSYFPAVTLLVGAALAQFSRRMRMPLWVVGLAVAGVNTWFYLAESPLARVLPRLVTSQPELRRQNAQLATWFGAIRDRYRPEQIQVWHADQWFLYGIRHFQYHLPEYENGQLSPDRALAPPLDRRYWRVQHRRISFVEQPPAAGTKTVVLVVPPGGQLTAFAPFCDIRRAVELPGTGPGRLYEIATGR